MNTLLVYSSKTGNTKKVADAISEALGIPALTVKEAEGRTADLVIAGCWIDRGEPNAEMKKYLGALKGQKVALFITLGALAGSDHAAHCQEAGGKALGEGSELVGSFICQGKVDPKLIEMMKGMFPKGHPHEMTPERIAEIHKGDTHPDANDLQQAKDYFTSLVERLGK